MCKGALVSWLEPSVKLKRDECAKLRPFLCAREWCRLSFANRIVRKVNGFDQPNGSGWQTSRDYFELRLLLSTNAFWPERAEHSFRVLGVTVTQSVSALNQVLFEKPQLELTGLLFPNAKGTHPRWRDNVVKYGLKPALKQLGIQAKDMVAKYFRQTLVRILFDT